MSAARAPARAGGAAAGCSPSMGCVAATRSIGRAGCAVACGASCGRSTSGQHGPWAERRAAGCAVLCSACHSNAVYPACLTAAQRGTFAWPCRRWPAGLMSN